MSVKRFLFLTIFIFIIVGCQSSTVEKALEKENILDRIILTKQVTDDAVFVLFKRDEGLGYGTVRNSGAKWIFDNGVGIMLFNSTTALPLAIVPIEMNEQTIRVAYGFINAPDIDRIGLLLEDDSIVEIETTYSQGIKAWAYVIEGKEIKTINGIE